MELIYTLIRLRGEMSHTVACFDVLILRHLSSDDHVGVSVRVCVTRLAFVCKKDKGDGK